MLCRHRFTFLFDGHLLDMMVRTQKLEEWCPLHLKCDRRMMRNLLQFYEVRLFLFDVDILS